MLAMNPTCIAVLPQVSLILFYYIYGTCLPHFQFIYIKRRKNIRCFKKFVRRISKNIRSFYPKRTENFGEGGSPFKCRTGFYPCWGFKDHPVEVKSGKTGTLRSLHSYIDQTGTKLAVRLYSGGYSVENAVTPIGKNPYTLINLPLFLSSMIGEYVRWVGNR